MALTQEDLAQLGAFIDAKVDEKVAAVQAATPPAPPAAPVPEVTQAMHDAAPWYYVHLADGRVLESQDTAATHYTDDNGSTAVIGRYPKEQAQ